jgi:hypothetical protein
VTATVLGGFLLGAALLTTGTASADQVAGGGRQVVFAGGVLGLPCSSTPSAESMIVPANGRVLLVNRTGHGAQLRLNGEAKGTIPDDGSTEVVFRRGRTSVTLDPSCAITDQTTPVLVTASPTPTREPDPIPRPSDPTASGAPLGPIGSGTPAAPTGSGSASPDAVLPTSRPQQSSTTRPGGTATIRSKTPHVTRVPARAATTAARARPQRGAASGVTSRTQTRGTARAVAPSSTGRPPGDDKTNLSGVPPRDLPAPTTSAEPDRAAGVSAGVVAAEPVATMRRLPESRPIGLLAVIAIVSVLGVATGSIRAFVSQRAYRANVL